MAYVAAGRFDGYWEREIHPWDIAAGMILVREAGGLISGVGEGAPFATGTVIAANSSLFADFRGLIRSE